MTINDYEIPAIGLSEAATDNIKNIVTRTAGNELHPHKEVSSNHSAGPYNKEEAGSHPAPASPFKTQCPAGHDSDGNPHGNQLPSLAGTIGGGLPWSGANH